MSRKIKNIIMIAIIILMGALISFTIRNIKINFNDTMQGLGIGYYIIFTIESIIILLLIVYLAMSKFNKKTIRETFIGANKIIYLVIIIVLTVGTIVLQIYLSNQFIEEYLSMQANIIDSQYNAEYDDEYAEEADEYDYNEEYDEETDEYDYNEEYDEETDEYNYNEEYDEEADEEIEEERIKISLSDEKITVDGKEIETTGKIYKTTQMNNGSDEAKAKSANIDISNIINIEEAGTYEFSGRLTDGQIAVNANKIEGYVNIILNNVEITCENAPAILVYSKNENATNCDVIIVTTKDSNNTINGGKIDTDIATWSNKDSIPYYIDKGYDEDGYYERYKYDGAISSDISLTFGGEGILNVISTKKEGIESKMDLTFDSGYYNIASKKNGIHACANNSLITMYDANIVVDVSDEGNGIESNGDIYINGGTVYAFSNAEDKNGLKSNLGISIDGGTVLSTGTKYEKLQTENDNEIIQMKFAQTLNPGENIIIVDGNGEIVFAFKINRKISTLAYSSEELYEDDYSVYSGDGISGELDENKVYTDIKNIDLSKLTKQGTLSANENVNELTNEYKTVIEPSRTIIIATLIGVGISLLAMIIILMIELKKDRK